jgi:hypothetical protein
MPQRPRREQYWTPPASQEPAQLECSTVVGLYRLRHGQGGRTGRPAPRRLETMGVILIVILILAVTLTRYWHNINWRAR